MELMEGHLHGTTSEIIFSILASLITFCTFLPYQIHVLEHDEENTPLNEFPPIPLWTCLLYNLTWSMFAFFYLCGNNDVPKAFHVMCLFVSSGLVTCFEYKYLGIYSYLGPKIKKVPCTMLLYFLVFTGFPFIAILIVLYAHPICITIGIITYASPLVIIVKCHKEENVERLPVPLCTGLFLNGLAWFIVSLVSRGDAGKFDFYLGVVNGVGALLGLLQLGIIYRLRNLYSNKIHSDVTSV